MRVRTAAKDFKVGMVAFLPYFDKLRKAKIIKVSDPFRTKTATLRTVEYKLLA